MRSDRIEPSKNIVRGVLAFAELLDSSPRLVSEVRFVMRLYASRTGLADYLAYDAEIDRVTERVNERFARVAGEPVVELDRGDDFAASLAALSIYDVLLVNPIRDGMNLVAKEGPIVNTTDGALALSDQAGAFAELGAVRGSNRALRRERHGRGACRGAGARPDRARQSSGQIGRGSVACCRRLPGSTR